MVLPNFTLLRRSFSGATAGAVERSLSLDVSDLVIQVVKVMIDPGLYGVVLLPTILGRDVPFFS